MAKLVFNENSSKEVEKVLKKSFNIKFGKCLRKLRKEKGLSQEELAFKASLHHTYVGHLETGTYTPSIFVVWKIAKALKVELREMLAEF